MGTTNFAAQLPNLIASVPTAMRNDSASLSGGTASTTYVPFCAAEYCEFPMCNPANVPDLPCLTHSTHNRTESAATFFGGLPWICHSMFLVYRHTMDINILRRIA